MSVRTPPYSDRVLLPSRKEIHILLAYLTSTALRRKFFFLGGPHVLFEKNRFFFGAPAGPRAVLAVSGLAVPARKMTLRRGA
jgi:hypothetical protein